MLKNTNDEQKLMSTAHKEILRKNQVQLESNMNMDAMMAHIIFQDVLIRADTDKIENDKTLRIRIDAF